MEEKNYFNQLNAIDVNGHTEQKQGLTYLSWAWAWQTVKAIYPDASYEIEKFNGLPYVFDPQTGYMVYTRTTINGITHEMWLPVMDSNNRAMKAEPYEVQTKNRVITVEAATMFDINKTLMRCLTKNLAMHGIGLYLYAGEDLPTENPDEVATSTKKSAKTAPKTEKVSTTASTSETTTNPEVDGPVERSIPSYVKEIGRMVQAMRNKEGNMDAYKATLTEVQAPATFKCSAATEADLDLVKKIYDSLVGKGY